MVADTAVVNPNGISMLLVNVVSTFFINGQTADKIQKSSLEIVSFNKTPLFSKDLITFRISFISLFVRVIPEPLENSPNGSKENLARSRAPKLVPSQAVGFSKILYQLRNHLRMLYESSKLVCQLIITYLENQFHNQNHKLHLMKDLKLLQYHFLLLSLTY